MSGKIKMRFEILDTKCWAEHIQSLSCKKSQTNLRVNSARNILKTERATYDKINEIIVTFDNSKLILTEGYTLTTDSLIYDVKNKIISSGKKSIFKTTCWYNKYNI